MQQDILQLTYWEDTWQIPLGPDTAGQDVLRGHGDPLWRCQRCQLGCTVVQL
jgi:hypothetical protein